MQPSQSEKLSGHPSEYLNIGITADGQSVGSIPVPWEHTAHAFNMKTPDIYLEPSDLDDAALMEHLRSYKVLGLYIFTPLESYEFIRGFPTLWDIFILNAQTMQDISFLNDLPEWFMLFVHKAVIADLEPLRRKSEKRKIGSCCIGFSCCRVGDISALVETQRYISELMVVQPEGAGERQRWQAVKASTNRYYEIRP